MLLKSRLPKPPGDIPLLHLGDFYRDIWTPSQDQVAAQIRLRREDPGAFEDGLRDALLREDICASTAALDALEACGELSEDQAPRLWSARLALQRWDDGLRLMDDQRFARPATAGYWRDLACAHAAIGSPKKAAAAAREAVALDPGNREAAELVEALARLKAYRDPSGGPAVWRGLIEHVSLLIKLHRFEQAAAALGAGMARFDEASSVKKLNLALDLARTLFRVLDPGPTRRLFRSLRPAFVLHGVPEIHDWAYAALGAPEPAEWEPPPRFTDDPFLLACVGQAFAAQGQWKTAAWFLGPAATLMGDLLGCRLTLARCIGRAVIGEVRPVLAAAGGRRKVVDVFRFQDELMLLKLKLEEMAPWVDRFVILEAGATFTGLPKPLLFQRHKHEFAAWADKIVHMVVDFPPWTDSPWAREYYQRDVGLKALSGFCGPDDIVLCSDADEIVDRKVIDSFTGEFAGLEMEVFKYFFNLRRRYPSQPIYTTAWRARYLDRIGLSTARFALPAYSKWHVLRNGGWHFTSMKDPEGLAAKLRAYSHTEYAGAKPGELARDLAMIRSGREIREHERWEIDERMPRAVRDNLAEISAFVL